MCMVSNIGDGMRDEWKKRPWYPQIQPISPPLPPPVIDRAEFDRLKKEVEELHKLLKAAQEFDAATGQPECEVDEKVAILRKVAKIVGVSLDDVLKPQTTQSQ